MVDPNSPAFNFSEKVGLLIGKGIRYTIIGGVVAFMGGKLAGPKPSHPGPNPPVPNPPVPNPPVPNPPGPPPPPSY